MSKYDIEELRSVAIYSATAAGHGSIAEDFAQEATLALSQGRKATISQLLTDFIRHEYGRSETGAKGYMWNEKRGFLELDHTQEGEPHSYNLDFNKHLSCLDSIERAYVVLYHKWGLSLLEIGDAFGLSEGRVSQQLSAINSKIKRFISKPKNRSKQQEI